MRTALAWRRRYHRSMRDLVSLPKAELHIHLEGSIRVGTVRELADRMGRPPPAALGPDDVWRFGGFEHFIDC